MPAFFRNIMGAMGVPDPIDQMEAYADAERDRNRAALDINNPAAAAAASPIHAATTQSPNQIPNAVKSDPSMGHMIAELSRQQQAEQGWNQAIGMGFGAFAQPRNREAVGKMFNVNPIDATKLGETIMSTGSQQQGQDRANQIASMVNDPKTGPGIAERLHMDWNNLKTMILTNPGAAAKIAEALGTPTPEMATLEQIQHMQGATGSGVVSAREIDDLRRLSLAGVAPEFAQQMVADQNTWRKNHGGQDPPWVNNKAAYEEWKADRMERQTSAAEFGKIHGQSVDKVTEFQHRVEALKTDPGVIALLTQLKRLQGRH